MKKFIAIVLVLAFAALPLAVSAEIELVNENIKTSVKKAAATPVIDGKLDAEAYAKIETVQDDFYFYTDSDYDAWLVANIPELYMSYDANNLYVFISGNGSQYYYCEHDDPDDTGNIWNQSCIQISASTADAEGGDRLEIGLARNHVSGRQLSNIWAQGSDSNGRDEYEMIEGHNYSIILDGGKINYEVSIPWTTFLPATPAAGTVFGFNFMFGISDDGNRQGFEYSSGCNRSKDASLFAKITLLDELTYVAPPPPPEPDPEPAPDVPAPAPEAPAAPAEPAAPAPATPAAPVTGDFGLVVLALLAASAFVVLRKKIAVK
ncbi:MAG: hypothetical protein FWD23_07685 [Oscillospiraceae bacterium]|nr:hypothetical protein [Oscillospiraceae bacterium]